MMTSMLVGLALLMASAGNCAGQKGGQSPSITQKEVSLNRGNDGQKVSAKVGQPIVVTLQTIDGGHYGTPQISSRAVRFESAMDAPRTTAEPRRPEAGVPLHGRCRGRNPDPNPAHRFKSHRNVYDSGDKTVTDWRVQVSDYRVNRS
jgi:hypothetical protein